MILLQNLPEIILISCDNDLHLCREYFLKNIGKIPVNFFFPPVLFSYSLRWSDVIKNHLIV